MKIIKSKWKGEGLGRTGEAINIFVALKFYFKQFLSSL